MKGFLCLLALALVIVLAKADDDKPCYDWDKEQKTFKDACEKCKEHEEKSEVDMCMYKEWGAVDDEGHVLPSNIMAGYMKGVDESKAEDVKEALEECFEGKTEPLTERKEVEEIWKCADHALAEKACPEFKPILEEILKDPELKICMYEHDD